MQFDPKGALLGLGLLVVLVVAGGLVLSLVTVDVTVDLSEAKRLPAK